MFTPVARFITGFNRLIGAIACWAVLALFVLLLADVVMRYFVGRPLVWTAELAQMIFGIYAVIAGGWLLSQRGHVSVDIFYGGFSRRRKAGVDLVTSLLFFTFVLVLLWQSWDMAWESMQRMERSNSVWKPYIWPVKMAVPIAAVLLLLQGIVRLVADIRVLLGLPVDPETWGVEPPEQERGGA